MTQPGPERPTFPQEEWGMRLPDVDRKAVAAVGDSPRLEVALQPFPIALTGDTRTARPPQTPMYPEPEIREGPAYAGSNLAHAILPALEVGSDSIAFFCSSNWDGFAARFRGLPAFSVMHTAVHAPEWVHSYNRMEKFTSLPASQTRAASNRAVEVNPDKYELVIANADMPASLQKTAEPEARTHSCRAGLLFALRALRPNGNAAFCFPPITTYDRLEIFAAICRVFDSVTAHRPSKSVDLNWIIAKQFKGNEATLSLRLEQLMTGQRRVFLCPDEIPLTLTAQMFEWNHACETFRLTGEPQPVAVPATAPPKRINYDPKLITAICDELEVVVPPQDAPVDRDPVVGPTHREERGDIADVVVVSRPSERMVVLEVPDDRDGIHKTVKYVLPREGVLGYLFPTGEFVQALHKDSPVDAIARFSSRHCSLIMQKASGFPVLPDGFVAFGMWSAHTDSPRFHVITTWVLSTEEWMPEYDVEQNTNAVLCRWGDRKPFIADPRISFATPVVSPALNGAQSAITVGHDKAKRWFYHDTTTPVYFSDPIDNGANGLATISAQEPQIVPKRKSWETREIPGFAPRVSHVVWRDDKGKSYSEVDVFKGTPELCAKARSLHQRTIAQPIAIPKLNNHFLVTDDGKDGVQLLDYSKVGVGNGAVRIQHRDGRMPLVTVARLNSGSRRFVVPERGNRTKTVLPGNKQKTVVPGAV